MSYSRLLQFGWIKFIWPPIHLTGEGNGTPLQCSCLENPMDRGAWWAAVHGVTKSRTRLNDFTFTFHFHALEKEMATHSSVLAWRIPGTGEPGGLPSIVWHDWSDLAAASIHLTGQHDHKHKQERWHKYISANICRRGAWHLHTQQRQNYFSPWVALKNSFFFFSWKSDHCCERTKWWQERAPHRMTSWARVLQVLGEPKWHLGGNDQQGTIGRLFRFGGVQYSDDFQKYKTQSFPEIPSGTLKTQRPLTLLTG